MSIMKSFHSGMCTLAALTSLAGGAFAQEQPSESSSAVPIIDADAFPSETRIPPVLTCAQLPDDAPCPRRSDRPGDCTRPICRGGRCVKDTISASGVACRDVDDDPLTLARCEPGTGHCDQRAIIQPRFTSDVPADVEVVALSAEPLPRLETFTDCCFICEHQSLEALSAPQNAGDRWERLDDGEPARRAKFCGEVLEYAVNDECDDTRDILLNIRPADGFAGFVEGFGRTNCDPGDPCIHAEVTPAQQFFREDTVFLPIQSEGRCAGGSCLGSGGGNAACTSNLETTAAEVCVYGPFALDHGPDHGRDEHPSVATPRDDHHEHPEIHPFDAIWWPRPGGNGYLFGVFQDDSNRYSHPYCGDDHNSNGWSQAPRDLRFRFPISFPLSEAPVRVDVRHLRTRNFDGDFHEIKPLNVTTRLLTDSVEGGERRRFFSDGELILEVVEEDGLDPETEIGIEVSVAGGSVTGFVNLRVAVGCDARDDSGMDCSGSNLRRASPAGRHDAGDPGSGYFLGEIRFRSAPARPSLSVRQVVIPADDPGRFDLRVDGETIAPAVGNGGTTGRRILDVGRHQVSNRAAAGTDPDRYRTTIGGACAPDGTVELNRGDDLVCTLTSRRFTPDDCIAQCDAGLETCKRDGVLLPRTCVAISEDCKQRCRP